MMDRPMYTPCAAWEEKLAATHPDDLSPSDRVALEMHVTSCSVCAAVLTEYQAIDALILDVPGVEPLPDLPIWLLHPRKKPARLNGSYTPVPMSSLAALTVDETGVVNTPQAYSRSQEVALPEPAREDHYDSQEVRESREVKERFFTRSEVMNSFPLGSMIKERYKLIDEIESGSFGTVYITRDIQSNCLYAAKLMHPEHSRDPELTLRFQREANILQSLSDPHIVSIIDFGHDNDVYFIVMEYVDGQSLKHYMNTSGKIEPLRAFDYTRQIAEGLQTAHLRRVVHRDIKPANILINNVGVVKITDFGMARGQDTPTITLPDEFMGTAYYISPEQVDSGHAADTRSDLYSLAIILFEMLTGHPPYEGSNVIDILIKHKQAEIPAIQRLRPNLPAEIDAFFQKSLAKSPTSRYSTPRDFMTALEQLQKQVQIERTPDHMKVPQKQAYLIVIASGQSIPLIWESMVVGRQDPSVGNYPEINLAHRTVGRQHACIRNRQGTFTVEDLGSTNKTRLNGVTLNSHQEHPLKDGCTLRFGSIEVRFELH